MASPQGPTTPAQARSAAPHTPIDLSQARTTRSGQECIPVSERIASDIDVVAHDVEQPGAVLDRVQVW
jgi:hypothetical protein